MSPEEIRLRMHAAGFLTIPCRGKRPAHEKGWQLVRANPDEIRSWSSFYPAAINTGVLTKLAPAFDADLLDPEAAAAVEELAHEWFGELGEVIARIGNAPKRLIPFRLEGEPFGKLSRSLATADDLEGRRGQKLEFLSDGQQYIAHGRHPLTGRDYAWHKRELGEVRLENLPPIDAAGAAKFMAAATRMLLERFGYLLPVRSRANGEATSGADEPKTAADLIDDIRAGRNLHDAIRDLAFELARGGMKRSAAEKFIYSQLDASTAERDDRFRERWNDVRRAVRTASDKIAEGDFEDSAETVDWSSGASSENGASADTPSAAASGESQAGEDAARSSAPSEEEWPEPEPIIAQLPPVLPLTREMLPGALSAYAFDIADRQQAPPDFAAIVAVVAAGATLGNKVRLFPKQFDNWEVVPNPWGALIGRPSAMKSPSQRAALAPLYKLEEMLREAWQAGLDAEAVNEALGKLRGKAAKKRAAKASDKGNLEEARSILEEAKCGEKKPPPCPRLIVNDATVPKFGELLGENPRGLLLVRDELAGWISLLEDERFQSDRAFYLETFNGYGSFTYDRIGRGTIHVENATVSVIGSIQPSRIASLVRSAIDGSQNDGLTQRLQLAVWPDDLSAWKWIDRRPALEAQIAYEETFNRLYELGKDDRRARFELGAQALFREWSEGLHMRALGNRYSAVVESHVLKMEKTLATLALIFEAVESGLGDDLVRTATLERALMWSEYLLGHAQRLYRAADTMAETGARIILERRAKLPVPFTARDVHQRGWAGLSDMDFVHAALAVLVATRHCRMTPSPIRTFGGRPTEQYRWNPKLGESGA
jgi:hypothetical protein